MRKYAGLLALILVVLATGVFFLLVRQTSQKPDQGQNLQTVPVSSKEEIVNWQAAFAIFTQGTFRDFSSPKYHNQSGDVFIQAPIPYIVHVKKRGITWDDFFQTLPMKLTGDCLTTGTGQTFCSKEEEKLKFYLNGEKVDDLLSRQIRDKDRVLVSFGSEGESQIRQQLEKVAVPQ